VVSISAFFTYKTIAATGLSVGSSALTGTDDIIYGHGGSSTGNLLNLLNNSGASFVVDSSGNLDLSGTITGGGFTGTLNASNISSGEFGSNTGGGNYSFPASLNIIGDSDVSGHLNASSLSVSGFDLDNKYFSAGRRSGLVSNYFGNELWMADSIYTVNVSGPVSAPYNVFRYGSTYSYFNEGTVVYEILGNWSATTSVSSRRIYIMNHSDYQGDLQIEIKRADDSWATAFNGSVYLSSSKVHFYSFYNVAPYPEAWNIKGIRFTFSNFGSYVYLAQLGLTNTQGHNTFEYIGRQGGSVYSSINMNNNKIINLDTPTDDYDAVPRNYVDTNFVPLVGGGGGTGSGFVQGGNSFGTTAILGTNDAYNLAFETNGTEKMTILANGNVGIGATNPVSKLTVTTGTDTSYNDGALKVIGNIALNSANNLNPSLNRWALRARPENQEGAFDIYDARFSLSRLLINSAGNVGIGTTGPTKKLHVAGAAQLDQVSYGVTPGSSQALALSTVEYVNSRVGEPIGSGSSGQTLRHDGTSWVSNSTLYNNGTNVGIGTDSPSAALEVASGDILLSEEGTATNSINYTSRDLLLKASGWDTNGSYARSGNWHIRNVPVDTIYPDYYLTFFEPGEQAVMTLTGRHGSYSSGNVGIGTTVPSVKLDVNGGTGQVIDVSGGQISGLNLTPMADDYAVSKSYVDTTFAPRSGGDGTDPGFTGDLNMGGNDITNVNKLTVNTIDPLYRIDNVLYSSYAPSMVGGVKEEYVGKTYINSYNTSIGQYEHIIDFDKVKVGSDLWLWRKVIDYSKDKVDVILSPYGDFASLYYKLEGNKIIFRSDKKIEASYRLVANRFDWKKWPILADDQEEKGGLFIE
jgi:hypothetical protein